MGNVIYIYILLKLADCLERKHKQSPNGMINSIDGQQGYIGVASSTDWKNIGIPFRRNICFNLSTT